jgi:deoxyribodipyrimidine photo-lyase
MKTAIWWLRRDLRLSDNQTLYAALTSADQIIPLFIIDPFFPRSPYFSQKRASFLWQGLLTLDADLRQKGSRLIVREGKPEQVLADITNEMDVQNIFAEEDYSPYARRRDSIIADSLPLHLIQGLTVHHPGKVLKQDKTPYIVYTAYKRAWKKISLHSMYDILPSPTHIPTAQVISSDPLPKTKKNPFLLSGEMEAQHRLYSFVNSDKKLQTAPIYKYAETRNRMDLNGTSTLSPYLRFGMLSARQATVSALNALQHAPNEKAQLGAQTWLNELIWREFYYSILFHFPYVRGSSFRSKYDSIPWINDRTDFVAWKNGNTGYPIVDAAQRQLLKNGFMHNRARMISASFLVKNLLVDWRWGEQWFMNNLLDGDPSANNGGWQWVAGTGTDAAPYFRIFNPILQSKKFDPHGEYIRRWVPELRKVSDKFIHEPWKMPLAVQEEINCIIGIHYPKPVIDLKESRQLALDTYAQAK